MVKETSKWNKQGSLFESQGYRKNKKYGNWELEDLPTVIDRFLYKVTNKRLMTAMDAVKEAVYKESDKLFTMIANVSINRMYDYWEDSPFTNRVWERLSRAYVLKKGHERFWFYKGNLDQWLRRTPPSEVFGRPIVEIYRNPKARGFQDMKINITPFPNAKRPHIEDTAIRNRLFGRHKWNGEYISNEEARPIIAPAMRALVKNRLRQRVMKVLKEAVENG